MGRSPCGSCFNWSQFATAAALEAIYQDYGRWSVCQLSRLDFFFEMRVVIDRLLDGNQSDFARSLWRGAR